MTPTRTRCARADAIKPPTGSKLPPPGPNALAGLLTRYAMERDVRSCTVDQLRWAIGSFSRCLGRHAELRDLADEPVNAWLAALQGNIRPESVKSNRRNLLIVWRWAYENELVEHLPRRLRKVRVPARIPACWGPEELRRLLDATSRLTDTIRRVQVAERDLMRAWILVGYYTGLRRGDLLAFRFDLVGADGWTTVIQSKTGNAVRCLLPEDARDAIGAMNPAVRCRTFADVLKLKQLMVRFRALVRAAGLRGSTKWLRASGATACEVANPGSAMAFLGHRTHGLAYRHYVDPARVQATKSVPPRIDQLETAGD